MRTNWETRLVGERVVLVPYRRAHVEKYHEWMQSPELLEATASEPLLLEEEFEMQASWRDDDGKCTFIVLDASDVDPASLDSSSLDRMIGDTNFFLQDPDEDDEDAVPSAEIEIMIAEQSARRKGLASEALRLMMRYGHDVLKLERFVAKIGAANAPSLALFESLGYQRVAYVEAFEEHELRWNASNEDALTKLPALQTAEDKDTEKDVYESAASVDQYVALHFGGEQCLRLHDGAPKSALNFPQRCAQILLKLVEDSASTMGPISRANALDVGCAVGGSTFELSKSFSLALGIDKSSSFVAQAKSLRDAPSDRAVNASVPVEGKSRRTLAVQLDANVRRARVEFATGDACDLGSVSAVKSSGPFSAVLLGNLLCRLPDPEACLRQLPALTKPQSVVLIVSPYTWMEEFTPRSKWLEPGEERVTAIMNDLGFDRVLVEDVPLIIREHERKYQYIVSQALGFRRRSE